jgi:hypothetical protein
VLLFCLLWDLLCQQKLSMLRPVRTTPSKNGCLREVEICLHQQVIHCRMPVGTMTSENYGITSGFFGEGEVGTAIEDNNGEDTDVPQQFRLHQNYPNPFNPRTSIAFDLPWKAEVRLVIYDLQGKEINQLLQETQSAGHYTVIWNGEDYAGRTVSSGVYFYRMMVRHLDSESGTIVKAGKMIFMK